MAHNEEMRLAWQFIANTGMSVFLTGKAGTGKTTFLHRLRELSPKRMAVLAPTGVAAINAKGQTIHSFFQLAFGPFIPGRPHDSKQDYKMSQQKKNLIRTLDLLIIDEVSMVRADLLDQVDDALRRYRDRSRPFGGVQLLLIGDLMQLSPVTKSEDWGMLSEYYDTPYFFSSHALKQLPYVTIELKHIYRQQDESFVNLLAKVRDGYITEEVQQTLNARYIPNFVAQGDDWIRLTTHNAPAQQYNDMRMAQLPSKAYTFTAEIKGDFPELSYPADKDLVLKVGAQVMFVKNDPSMAHAYYNGKIGVVSAIDEDTIYVKCDKGTNTIPVAPVVWDNTKYTLDPVSKMIKEDVVGTFTQYPLRLAWAITVHKSQGLTFDHAVLDINSSFAHGQVYVALSRCRTLEGLVLSSPIYAHSVITDHTVNQYVETTLSAAGEIISHIDEFKFQYTLSLLDELYDFSTVTQDFDWLVRVVDEHLSRQQPHLLCTLKATCEPIQRQLYHVAMRFGLQYKALLQQSGADLDAPALAQRIKESAVYFSKKLHEIFDPIFNVTAINIENKAIAKIYSNALEALRQSVSTKTMIFEKLIDTPFNASNYLNLKAKAALTADAPAPARRTSKKAKASADDTSVKKEKKPKKGNTLEETRQLFASGLSVAEIAKKRGLVESTIYTHLAALAAKGAIDVDKVVPIDHQRQIVEALKTFKGAYTLTDVRNLLPEDISFGEIKIVIQAQSAPK